LSDEEGKPADELHVGVAHDMRLTSPELAARYSEGMRDEGADVLDVGQVATEMLYFTVGARDLDGGLMCTASHNPKPYAGAKLVGRGAIALSGARGMGDIARLIAEGDPGPPVVPPGAVQALDISQEFQEAAMAFIDPSNVREMRVVLDGGNGMAGPTVGPLLDRLPVEQVQTYWKPDGNFPDHEPNPLLPENRTFIVKKVL